MANENSTPNPAEVAKAPEGAPQTPEANAGGRKVITPPIDMLAERMRLRVNQNLLRSDLSSVDRNSMNQLAGTLALRSEEKDKASVRLEYLLCFLEGDIDWKKRYKEVFGLEPPKERSKATIPKRVRNRSRRGPVSDQIEEPEY